jgi:sugar lactone lactonase YvrE
MRGPTHFSEKSCRSGASVVVALWLVAGQVGAKTQGVTLPLVLPSAIAFDAQGDLYFADAGEHMVRMLSVAGVITTVAGNGVQGSAGDGGLAAAAELDSPTGLAVDAAGDLYIADSHNQRVREVSAASGMITTIAGTGVAGFAGDRGPATAAQLDMPTALALDAAGDVIVADRNNHRVRMIGAVTRTITTIAGDGVEGYSGDGGLATAAAIDSPDGLAVDAAGNLYLADTHNGRVREVSAATGRISTVVGVGFAGGNVQSFGGDGGVATAAGLALPRGLSLDAAGNVYVADSANQRIRRISPAGVITTIAGQGTEAFAGDNAAAVMASLDSPRSVAVSPGGLVTLADSGNQRVRQIDAQPAPGPDIHTLLGIGTTTPGLLQLSGPAVSAYGSGSVTATLSTTTNATGSVTFLDTSGGATVTLGVVGLSADVASLSTTTLAAGAHSIVAVYAGDATHGAAQSQALALAVTPLPVMVTANSAAILYGQDIPALSGAVSGVLQQDAGKVAVVFTTTAGMLSPVGAYAIAATLGGSSAGNYWLGAGPVGSLSISQAPTLTTLVASTSNPGLGSAESLSVRVASTTSGVPTGSVMVSDGTTVLGVVALAGGTAAFNTTTLVLGTHSLSAVYSGDGSFLGSTSAIATVTVGAAQDFTLAATGASSQVVPAGSAATYSFSVGMVGAAMTSPITLAAQGLPLGATASFSPNYIPPGGTVTSFTLTIQTPLAAMEEQMWPDNFRFGKQVGLVILLLPMMAFAGRRRRVFNVFSFACVVLFATLATGCGNRVNTENASIQSTAYTLTVTGTATGPTGNLLLHTAVVTLRVLQ